MDLLSKFRGISKLFDWQEEILKLPCIYNGSNLVYSCPTGGGKTLVSELILMREVLSNHKNAIYIVPFVSLAHEKVSSLAPLGCSLGFHVEEYASSKGCIPPRKRYKRNSIYVATIEKASLLINSLIEENRIDTIGAMVVDEVSVILPDSYDQRTKKRGGSRTDVEQDPFPKM
ncbi:Helicase POLQ-like protein [Thelohanellus kitauei]|uniref:Helicase POLQ-like protein n=1 Tax=Thelohanellus kitauei TaxID=669202 RepID=A0A0C2IZ30_THEKT|nr:Helicase POLQ-like protein [Thelohanellus kitauei]